MRTAEQIKNKGAAAAVLSAFMSVSLWLIYCGHMKRLFEMTFLSNFLSASVLLFGSLSCIIKERDIPDALYLDCTALLLTVVCVCSVFAPSVTLVFPSVMLHLINPLAMLAFYCFYCDGSSFKAALTALIFPWAYYLFMIVYGVVFGESVYPYFDTVAMSRTALVVYGIVATVIVTALAAGLSALTKLKHNEKRKGEKSVERSFNR